MKDRIVVTVFYSEKIPDGQEVYITSVNDDLSFWVLWINWDGTKSRAKLDLSSATICHPKTMEPYTVNDLKNHWLSKQ